ncbi:MAG: nicotinate-nucleotide--dimethylbenzimidazole phosphoribosyltransferase [bacterium]|nr:nicotinate-nucleotide--dimethylbenzimidazole phosphoribosyltransferase [bacterium]
MTSANTASRVPELSPGRTDAIQHKIDRKTKPPGSLGRLEELAVQLGRIQDSLTPEVRSPAMLVFAGDHGATEAGISPYPKEVTAQMVHNFLNGGAAINVFARQNDLLLHVVDAGVDADFPEALLAPIQDAGDSARADAAQSPAKIINAKVRRGTRNFVHEDALNDLELQLCFERGARIAQALAGAGTNAVGFGEMGIGNTSAASLLQTVLTGRALADCVGRGTGHDDAGLQRKREILAQALERFRADHPDSAQLPASGRPEENDESQAQALALLARSALRSFGGLEIAMMSGAMIEAAAQGMLIVVDGYITTAAALAAIAIEPGLRDYCVFAHVSGEQGHRAMLDWLDARPLLDLEMRLGEGTGAALAFSVVAGAANFLNEMASFEDAGVSDRADDPD